jgi:hypothetical protein
MALSKIAHATGSTSVTVPATAQAGDLGVYFDFGGNLSGGPPAQNAPVDWTEISNITDANARACIYGKILDSDDPSATLGGINGNFDEDKIVVIFRSDAGAVQSFTPSIVNSSFTGNNPSQQSAAASGGTAPLIVFGRYGSSGAISPRTFDPAADEEIQGDGTNHYSLYKIYDSNPADHTGDMGDEGSANVIQMFYIAVEEPGAPTIGWDPESATAGHTAAPFDLTSQASFSIVGALIGHTANALGFTVASSFEINDAIAGHTAGDFDLNVPIVFRVVSSQAGHTAAPFRLSSQVSMAVAPSTQGHRSNPYLAFVPRQGPYDLSVYPDTRAFIVTPDGRALSVPVRAEFFDVKGETRVLIVPQRTGTVYAYEDRRVGPQPRVFKVPSRQFGNTQRQGSASQDTTQPLDTDFLQLEDGTYLLQEDGSNLKL